MRDAFNADLHTYLTARSSEFEQIDAARRTTLGALALQIERGVDADLVFICTHNSRRSHFGQIWAQAAAVWFGRSNVRTYSGGTEATAFEPRAIAALQRAGMQVERSEDGANPRYLVRLGSTADAWSRIECFSKHYESPPNPRADFIAVMTCAQADAGCPLVLGATARIALPYEDPKAFDGSARETAAYDACCAQIAREMLFCFEQATLSGGRRAGS